MRTSSAGNGNFWDLEGLEINVRAYVAALESLWPEMEPRLLQGVADDP